MENSKFPSDYCKNIIKVFSEEEIMESHILNHKTFGMNRSYKRFIINNHSERKQKYQWLWDSVDNLIKNNLNNNHYLSKWIIVLRYDIGDYFNPHTDNPNPSDTDDRSLSGGIELSNKDDFDGGEYIVRDINNPFERGKLFTHKLTELHEITKVTKGTRWSLHFGIHKSKTLF